MKRQAVYSLAAAILCAACGSNTDGDAPTTTPSVTVAPEDQFVALAGELEGFEGRTDAELLDIGRKLCTYLQTFRGQDYEDTAWASAIDLVTGTGKNEQVASTIVAGSVTNLCPGWSSWCRTADASAGATQGRRTTTRRPARG